MHIILTQFSHKPQHRTQNTTIMQHIQDTENNTENSTENTPDTPDTEQKQYPDTSITYDLHTYSFDLYHEFAYIKNSDTIELYTILQDKI